MKLESILKEAINLARTDSFPVFLDKKPVGRIYLVTEDDIDWLSQGESDVDTDYVVLINGIEPEKLTDKNMKYYAFSEDFEESEDKEKLAGMFTRAFGYFERVKYNRHK